MIDEYAEAMITPFLSRTAAQRKHGRPGCYKPPTPLWIVSSVSTCIAWRRSFTAAHRSWRYTLGMATLSSDIEDTLNRPRPSQGLALHRYLAHWSTV